jgi:hypothetical protein
LASTRIGPYFELLATITVGPVEVDAAALEEEGVVDGCVAGGCVAVEVWLDDPPPQAAKTNAAEARISVPPATEARRPPAGFFPSRLQLNIRPPFPTLLVRPAFRIGLAASEQEARVRLLLPGTIRCALSSVSMSYAGFKVLFVEEADD